MPTGRGVLEVVVTENGDVESANLRQPMTPVYDHLVLSAAKGWKYHPATKNGQPVRYKKLIQVTLMNQ
jgi:TonB family protein